MLEKFYHVVEINTGHCSTYLIKCSQMPQRYHKLTLIYFLVCCVSILCTHPEGLDSTLFVDRRSLESIHPTPLRLLERAITVSLQILHVVNPPILMPLPQISFLGSHLQSNSINAEIRRTRRRPGGFIPTFNGWSPHFYLFTVDFNLRILAFTTMGKTSHSACAAKIPVMQSCVDSVACETAVRRFRVQG
jgi:hypothetical protein